MIYFCVKNEYKATKNKTKKQQLLNEFMKLIDLTVCRNRQSPQTYTIHSIL